MKTAKLWKVHKKGSCDEYSRQKRLKRNRYEFFVKKTVLFAEWNHADLGWDIEKCIGFARAFSKFCKFHSAKNACLDGYHYALNTRKVLLLPIVRCLLCGQSVDEVKKINLEVCLTSCCQVLKVKNSFDEIGLTGLLSLLDKVFAGQVSTALIFWAGIQWSSRGMKRGNSFLSVGKGWVDIMQFNCLRIPMKYHPPKRQILDL